MKRKSNFTIVDINLCVKVVFVQVNYMRSKRVFMVDRTTVDVHAVTKIHIYVVRVYVLV